MKDILKKHNYVLLLFYTFQKTLSLEIVSIDLVGSQLNRAVADAANVVEHLASWGSRQGPCAHVTPQWAPRSLSQLKLLLQERLKLKQEKLNVLFITSEPKVFLSFLAGSWVFFSWITCLKSFSLLVGILAEEVLAAGKS